MSSDSFGQYPRVTSWQQKKGTCGRQSTSRRPSHISFRRIFQSCLDPSIPEGFWVLLNTGAWDLELPGREGREGQAASTGSALDKVAATCFFSIYETHTLECILNLTVPRIIYSSVGSIFKIPLMGNRLSSWSSSTINPNILKFDKVWKELQRPSIFFEPPADSSGP